MTDTPAPAMTAAQEAAISGVEGDPTFSAGPATEAPEAPQAPAEAPKSLEIQPKAAADGERPAWLPSKFKTPEDMARSYQELEKKVGTPAQVPAPAAKGKAGDAPPPAVDYAKFNQELVATGGLSDASYAELEAANIPRGMADAYIAGQKSIAQGVMSQALNEAGGADQFEAMREWAAGALDAETLATFNENVASGDQRRVMFAVKCLKSLHQAAGAPGVTQAPKVQLGGKSPAASKNSDRFNSRNEQTLAMRDPRYGKDQAYTRAVVDRTARSEF